TATGSTIGTVAYMAPERINGEDGDHRADIYALGCVLHEMLTGRTAVTGSNIVALMYAHLQAPPPRPSLQVDGLPAELDAVIATALAKDPDERFAQAGLLADAAREAVRAIPATTATGPAVVLPVDPPTRPLTGDPTPTNAMPG